MPAESPRPHPVRPRHAAALARISSIGSVKVQTGPRSDRLEKAHPWKRRGEVQGGIKPLQHLGPQAVLHHAGDHGLGELHHVTIVRVRLVELQHRELGIVGPVHPFVPEVVPDLVHPLESADQQPLEVQLVGDAQVQRHVQRVVVSHERTGRRAAIEWLEDRRLDLEKTTLIEKAAHVARSPWPGAGRSARTSGWTARSA